MNITLEIFEKSNKIKRPAGCLQHHGEPNRNGSYEDHVMANRQLPSPEVLRQLLRYEPETGKLFWRNRSVELFAVGKDGAVKNAAKWNARFAGKEAFSTASSDGYFKGELAGKTLFAHRVIWAIQTGAWPDEMVDHINGVRTDNRWINLRAASPSENQHNRGPQKNNTSGYKGVSWDKNSKAWRAQIKKFGKETCFGPFETALEASEAYQRAAAELHGSFAKPPPSALSQEGGA